MARLMYKVGDHVLCELATGNRLPAIVRSASVHEDPPYYVEGDNVNGYFTEDELTLTLPNAAHPRTHNPVYFPSHYTRGGIELIDVLEAWELDHLLATCVAYIMRSGYKGTQLQDLHKARRYLNREINRLEGRQPLDWESHVETEGL